jgi:3-keto-5-aminohexanoate cleavage enzyme
MNDLGVRYEMECFEKGHIDTTKRFIKKGVIKNHLHYSFVLGVRGGMTGEERDFMFLKESIPSNATFSVAGIGRYEFSLAELSIKHGGHVRVGLEDNIYLEKGLLTKSNAQLVEKVVKIANKYGRQIATPQETRKILEMENKQNGKTM